MTTTAWDVDRVTITQQRIILGGTVYNLDSMTKNGFYFGQYRMTTKDKFHYVTGKDKDGMPKIATWPKFLVYRGKQPFGWLVVKKDPNVKL